MADVYVDLDLVSGLNDGTSWANAYQTAELALNGSNAVSGDDVWIQGTQVTTSAISLIGGMTVGNPVRLLGVATGTTNEPPVTADLIAGWRTGETRTEANLAYNDAGIPVIEINSAANDMTIAGQFYCYGVQFKVGDNIQGGTVNPTNVYMEECCLTLDQIVPGQNNGPPSDFILKNCHIDHLIVIALVLGNTDSGSLTMIGGKYTNASGANTAGLLSNETLVTKFIGVDLSDAAHTLFASGTSRGNADLSFQNCQLNASTSIFTGTRNSNNFRIELYQTANVTGKSSGTLKNFDIATDAGDITEEETAVRTGGFDDGDGGMSFAFTPVVNGTRDQYYGLIGPWMAFKVSGDGTSKTVTVYIANSGGADYNNDDVWLEVIYPSEGGTAQFDNQTTQMNLLATPAAVTDDTDSTWGTGGNNPQKLEATIAPDYVGLAYCRVVFAKNFGSSPETLYVDPLPVVT